MLNFKKEFKDVVNVDNVIRYCFGSDGDMTPESIKLAGGGSKFSSLCGMKFISKVNPTYKHGEFMIVFCVKLRSKIYRQAHQNPSQWFAFLQTGNNQIEVLDKRHCMLAFDFDIDKFFQTDLFENYAKVFINDATEGVAKAEEIIGNAPQTGSFNVYEFLPRYVNAIKDSIPLISSKTFNDKKFTLTMQFEDPNIKLNQKLGKSKFDPKKFADFIRNDQERTAIRNARRKNMEED